MRILAVHWSQSGQLDRVMDAVVAPLAEAGHAVDRVRLSPTRDWPFPWSFWNFLDAFPECVSLDARPNEPVGAAGPYDLVILGYTVWFLSPAPPITAFLQSDAGRTLLKDTPVITLTACRNMWVQAQEAVKALLVDAGARHMDHVALIDPGPSLATFITTPRWMLTGRRDAFWGLPPAGLTDADVAGAGRFGRAIARRAQDGPPDGMRPWLTGLGAARVDPALLASEHIGRRSFGVWGKLVRLAGGPGSALRRPVLAVYVVFLVLMIVTVVPLSMLIRALLRPVMRDRLEARAARYEQPSGRDTARLGDIS